MFLESWNTYLARTHNGGAKWHHLYNCSNAFGCVLVWCGELLMGDTTCLTCGLRQIPNSFLDLWIGWELRRHSNSIPCVLPIMQSRAWRVHVNSNKNYVDDAYGFFPFQYSLHVYNNPSINACVLVTLSPSWSVWFVGCQVLPLFQNITLYQFFLPIVSILICFLCGI
jgi:hypothetical protein